jgi:uncharacterized protein YnzC (UPF0291/DUF896 family)
MHFDEMLRDEKIKRFHTNLSKGSILTARMTVSRLGRFQDLTGIAPKDLLDMKSQELTDMLIDKFDEFEKKQKLRPSYIMEFKKSIKAWLAFNGKKVDLDNVKIRKITYSTDDEQVPTQDQLRTTLSVAPPKTKVMIAMIAFSFVRPEVLGNYDGTDGLVISDFKEMEIKDGTVNFTKIPTLVSVRDTISKNRRRYLTYLPDEGCECVKSYLEMRLRDGERLTPESRLLPGDGKFMSTDSIGKDIRRSMRKAGFTWRPYILKSYGATQLDIGEAKGMVSHAWRAFWMGHSGDIEARYSTSKRLSPEFIDEMRASYAKVADAYLTTTRRDTSKEMMVATFNRQFLRFAKWTDAEIDALGDLSAIENTRLQELLDQKSMQRLGLANGSKQKVVPMEEVENYISQGWEYVKDINGSKAIIKLPAH